MKTSAWKQNQDLVIICVVLALTYGALLARFYMLSRNTLHNNGDWISTKTTLEMGVPGKRAFIHRRQALARGNLNLGAWWGFQEVIYHEPIPATKLTFNFRPASNAYLVVTFNRTADGFSGFRLSSDPRFPCMRFRASSAGAFMTKTPMTPALLAPAQWHHAEIAWSRSGTELALNGENVVAWKERNTGLQSIGFRSGRNDVFVDDVRVEGPEGLVLKESFRRHAGAPGLTAIGMGLALMINGCVLAILFARDRDGARTKILRLVMLNVMLTIAAGGAVRFAPYIVQFYPKLTFQMQASESRYKSWSADGVRQRIRNEMDTERRPGVARILLIGTSQTWGAGAAEADHVFAKRLAARLRADHGIVAECVNGGVPAVDSIMLLKIFKEEWIKLKPDLVVINLASNDQQTDTLRANLDELIRSARSIAARVLLIAEPNSIEHDTDYLLKKHEVVKSVASEHSVALLDMHSRLAERYDDGFLWWDFVHLSSFGHTLFTEYLIDAMSEHDLLDGMRRD